MLNLFFNQTCLAGRAKQFKNNPKMRPEVANVFLLSAKTIHTFIRTIGPETDSCTFVELIFCPISCPFHRMNANSGHLTECQRHINVSNYIFHPCMVLFASKAPLLVVCLWPSRAITHSGPSSHNLALYAPLFTTWFPGPDHVNLSGSRTADL